MDGYLHTVYPHEYDPTRGANPHPQPRAATDRPRSTALDRRRFQNHRSHRSREQTIDRSIDSIDRHPLPVDGASALERARMPTTTRRVRVGGRGKTPRTRTIADAFRHAKSGIGVARDKKRGACARARASFSCEFSSFPTRARGVDRWTDERWMCARAQGCTRTGREGNRARGFESSARTRTRTRTRTRGESGASGRPDRSDERVRTVSRLDAIGAVGSRGKVRIRPSESGVGGVTAAREGQGEMAGVRVVRARVTREESGHRVRATTDSTRENEFDDDDDARFATM